MPVGGRESTELRVLNRRERVHGFYDSSSMERLPREGPISETMKADKATKLRRETDYQDSEQKLVSGMVTKNCGHRQGGRSKSHLVIRYVVALKVAFCRFDSIIHRLRSFAGRTADVAFMTIPCTPHHPGFTLLDVNCIPNPTFCVIMPVNFFGYHADLLPSANLRPRGQRSKRANDFRFAWSVGPSSTALAFVLVRWYPLSEDSWVP